jgi:hypothetical protein
VTKTQAIYSVLAIWTKTMVDLFANKERYRLTKTNLIKLIINPKVKHK